jgi:signal transduction histidine kinase
LDEIEAQPGSDSDTRVERYTRESDLTWVAAALAANRDEILTRWTDVASDQPFHRGRRGGAVADHIPTLLEALTALLIDALPRATDPPPPSQSIRIRDAAQAHALARTRQGLAPTDVLVEFRLLRQELGHALRQSVPDGAPTSDVMAAELFLNDALDSAMAMALGVLSQQIEQVREEFVATTVHELGQPLTVIRGHVQIMSRHLATENPDIARVKAGITSILEATNELSSLLTNLGEASRARLGNMNLQIEPTDLRVLIPDVVAQLEPEVRSRVRLEFAGRSTTGPWDPSALGHVFANLLGNAAKYSPAGTPITVKVHEDSDEASVTVLDGGIGIPPDEVETVFDRYGRGRNAIENRIDGLGLGLYLSRTIVEAHGGRIWLESTGTGQGTAVHVVLPRHAGNGE